MGGSRSGRYGGRPTSEACNSLVLQITTFRRAGLRFGVRGYSTLTFTSDYEQPFAVTIETDTTVRQAAYMRFAHVGIFATSTGYSIPHTYL
jgi:hypothetical protein